MTKQEERVPALLPDANSPSPKGWLQKAPLPIKTEIAASPRSREPDNALAHTWQTCLVRYYPLQYHKPFLIIKESRMLANFGCCVGDQSKEVIEFAIKNWSSFVAAAEKKYGLFGPQPLEPSIRFFVEYHDCAVNLFLESIARKKQQAEREAEMARMKNALHARVQPTPTAAASTERPLTREEALAIYRDLTAGEQSGMNNSLKER